MASIQTRQTTKGKRYKVQIRLAGYPSLSRTFPTKALAKAWARDMESDLKSGKYSKPQENYTVADLIDRYSHGI